MKQSFFALATLIGSLTISTNPTIDDYQTFVRRIFIELGQTNPAVDLIHHTPLSEFAERFVVRHTKRQNFVFFSYYQSEVRTYLDSGDMYVSSVGALGNFFVLESSFPWSDENNKDMSQTNS
jgi:Domain of unknown function (DUF4359)